ncbi:YbgC/FadM family acyl-CoA thioesterase [bacterium]|nr:YbgC/FadM family acyl-CoA thioesterase [bacterium]
MTPAPHHHEYVIRVGYADTDQMGFVHHSRYLVYFESARTELLRTTGTSYRQWEERGVLLPLTGCSVDFIKAGRYDDVLAIRTRLESCSRLRVSFRYEVVQQESATLLATGATHHVFMTPDGKPTRAPADLLGLLAPFIPPTSSSQ